MSVVAASVCDMALQMAMVTIDCADPRKLAEFWTAALGTAVAQDFGGEFLFLNPPEGGLSLGLQRVPEERAGKNRVHIDFGSQDREEEVKRLVELGAIRCAADAHRPAATSGYRPALCSAGKGGACARRAPVLEY